MLPAFAASADFATDKAAGSPCPNLDGDLRCGIHARLRQRGFPGCAAYDCFGAGQRVSQMTFDGQDWRGSPEVAAEMSEVFPVMRQLHELLGYLEEALARTPPGPLRIQLAEARGDTDRAADGDPCSLRALDVAAHGSRVAGLLRQVSAAVRAGAGDGSRAGGRARDGGTDRSRKGQRRRGADLIGADLRGKDLRGADLAGAYLIGADLRGARLGFADLLGADLRGADLRGADLTGAVFVTAPQLASARVDPATRLPARLDRPAGPAGRTGEPGP